MADGQGLLPHWGTSEMVGEGETVLEKWPAGV